MHYTCSGMRTWRRAVTVLLFVVTGLLLVRWWQQASKLGGRRVQASAEADEPDPASGPRVTFAVAKRPSPSAAPSAAPAGPVLDRAKADKMRAELHALFADAGVLALGGAPLEASAPAPRQG